MTKSTSAFLKVNSDKVQYSDEAITSQYTYQTVTTTVEDGEIVATPVETKYEFKTQTTVPKTGVMFVGLGGNNGTTVMAGVLANKLGLSWGTKEGGQSANYFGSLTQASTIRVGTSTETGKDTYIPFSGIVPMVNPDNLVIGGWDINNMNMADAMERAKVLDYDLQRQLRPHMEAIVPLPSVYEEDFIASNQKDRANNVLQGTKGELVEILRADIRNFKAENGLDKVIVLWTANTERFCEVSPELNGTKAALLASIEADKVEVSPSTLFAVAALKEGCPYINGSPQNALVPGVIEMAKELRVPVAGDDFKTGQTKIKSVLVDFLVSAGIKPISIVSYNHLGNNDGKNLQSQKTFASKEKSKANVVDDMIESNNILYAEGEHPDHCVVIKYVPAVGDSKRALDEYTSEIFLGGKNTIVMHNTCEDSLLAAPLILDLVILTELFSRISFKTEDMDAHTNVHPVLSILSFLLKAPVVPEGAPVVNALFAQRAAIVNTLRACVGLPPVDDMRMGQMTL